MGRSRTSVHCAGASYAEIPPPASGLKAHSNVTNSSVAKTSSGNTYASHDGNVYKNDGDGWQKYDGGGNWNNVQKPNTSNNLSGQTWDQHAQSTQNDWKSNWNSSNLQSSWDSHSSSGGAGNSWANHDTQANLNSDSWSRN
jgi:hypothetical protein